MANGVPVLDTITKKCYVEKLGKNKFKIVLTQGLNRQIRRMCAYFGYNVIKLERVRIMNVKLDNLKTGSWRYLSEKELKEIDGISSVTYSSKEDEFNYYINSADEELRKFYEAYRNDNPFHDAFILNVALFDFPIT